MRFTIQTNITWKHKKNTVFFNEGKIVLEEGLIKVQGKVSLEDADKISAANPAYIDICDDFQKHITYQNSHIDETAIELDLSDTKVLTVQMGHSIECDFCSVSYELSSLKYTYETENPDSKCLFAVPYIFLEQHFRKLDFGAYKNCYKILDDRYTVSSVNTNFTWISPYNDTLTNDILPLISLYTKCSFDILCIYKSIDINKQWVFWNTLQHDSKKEYLRNYELNYINIGGNNTLQYLLDHNSLKEIDTNKRKVLSRAIRTYAESKYIPKHIRFITLYSILDKFAGGYGQNTYREMTKGLKRYSIDIKKIGKSTESEIRRWKLILERTNGKDSEVHNFCDLRNYIVHFMSNNEIDEYLERNNLVHRLELAVVIILLKELGLTQCNFKKNWEHMSILCDTSFPFKPKCTRNSNKSLPLYKKLFQFFWRN